LDIEKEGTKTSLNNLYSPNNDSGICEIIENVVNKSIVITGDFNLVQNHFWFQLYLSIELSYDQASPTRHSSKKTLCWTNFYPCTHTYTCSPNSLVSYIATIFVNRTIIRSRPRRTPVQNKIIDASNYCNINNPKAKEL
jgi:hypothetical protein